MILVIYMFIVYLKSNKKNIMVSLKKLILVKYKEIEK